MFKPMNWIFLGAVIVVIGGLISAIATFFHNKRSSEKTDRIVVLQHELIEKSEQLRTAQNELLKYTTGGDSFGEVQVLRLLTEKGKYGYIFYFTKHGAYPLYDVKVTALDRDKVNAASMKENANVATMEDLKAYVSFVIGDVGQRSGGASFGDVMYLKEGKSYDYLFTVSTLNSTFYQELKFIVKDDSVIAGTSISMPDGKGGKTMLFQHTDDNFSNVP